MIYLIKGFAGFSLISFDSRLFILGLGDWRPDRVVKSQNQQICTFQWGIVDFCLITVTLVAVLRLCNASMKILLHYIIKWEPELPAGVTKVDLLNEKKIYPASQQLPAKSALSAFYDIAFGTSSDTEENYGWNADFTKPLTAQCTST